MSMEIGRLSAFDNGNHDIHASKTAAVNTFLFDSVEAAERDWRALLPVATVSPYQCYETQAAWSGTVGRARGLRPFIIVARDADGHATALLPFTIENFGPLRIARFIGGRESNFNLGLFAPGIDARTARALLQDAARRGSSSPDLYDLRNMPRVFDGVANPLAFPQAKDSASFGYGVTLPGQLDELAARTSKDTRKKLRKKEARLAEMGALRYEHCATCARAQVIVEALIEQKSARFAQMGVEPLAAQPGMRDFLQRAVAEKLLELHALSVGERIVAVYAGFTHDGRFSAMLNSFDMDEEIARTSPGDLLLHALMRNLVSRGLTRFDLGAGEARYKQSVCDETIELCDAVIPVTAKGAMVAPLLVQTLRIKRHVKQSPALSRALMRLRKHIA